MYVGRLRREARKVKSNRRRTPVALLGKRQCGSQPTPQWPLAASAGALSSYPARPLTASRVVGHVAGAQARGALGVAMPARGQDAHRGVDTCRREVRVTRQGRAPAMPHIDQQVGGERAQFGFVGRHQACDPLGSACALTSAARGLAGPRRLSVRHASES